MAPAGSSYRGDWRSLHDRLFFGYENRHRPGLRRRDFHVDFVHGDLGYEVTFFDGIPRGYEPGGHDTFSFEVVL